MGSRGGRRRGRCGACPGAGRLLLPGRGRELRSPGRVVVPDQVGIALVAALDSEALAARARAERAMARARALRLEVLVLQRIVDNAMTASTVPSAPPGRGTGSAVLAPVGEAAALVGVDPRLLGSAVASGEVASLWACGRQQVTLSSVRQWTVRQRRG